MVFGDLKHKKIALNYDPLSKKFKNLLRARKELKNIQVFFLIDHTYVSVHKKNRDEAVLRRYFRNR